MRRASVVYRESGFYGELAPEWLIYDLGLLSEASWGKRLYIPINAPFERQEIDDFDDTASITVPISAYTVREDKPNRVGVHLPTVAAFAEERCHLIGATFNGSLIRRLIMRLADIEEILHIDVRFHIQNGGFD